MCQYNCSMCWTFAHELGTVRSLAEMPKPRKLSELQSLRRMCVQDHKWPGCETDPSFTSKGTKTFNAVPFWDDDGDCALIQSRREAAEKAIGFRLNKNALWDISSFDPCVQVFFLPINSSVLLNIICILFSYCQHIIRIYTKHIISSTDLHDTLSVTTAKYVYLCRLFRSQSHSD